MKLTVIVIAAAVVLITGYDIYVSAVIGTDSTISWTLWTLSQRYPIIPFVAGAICATCKFFQATEPKTGKCRRYPPAIQTFFLTNSIGVSQTISRPNFIPVDSTQWCGEYIAVSA